MTDLCIIFNDVICY